MKITHIGHASLLIEVDGITILSDPWWRGPCFGAQWWIYPAPFLEALKDIQVNYIYISHGHHDHFHPGTLKTFDRSTKILISNSTGIAESVREIGFEVIGFEGQEEVALTDKVRIRIIPTHNDDTLMTVTDGYETCVNVNDALHSAPLSVQDTFIARLKSIFPRIDYLFCGYGVASHFPNCYEIPGKDRALTAGHRQQYFNRQWVRIVDGIQPRFGFPFAADVVFLENDLFWVNEPIHNTERPTDVYRHLYPSSVVEVYDIAPGFKIENGKVINEVLRIPVSADALSEGCADSIIRANRYGSVLQDDVRQLIDLLRTNVEVCKKYLLSFDGSWRFLIRLRNSDLGIVLEKRAATIEIRQVQVQAEEDMKEKGKYDLTYTVRPAYLKLSLTQPYGDEILFVGSGGIFKYASQEIAKTNLHRELMTIVKKHVQEPKSRYGDQPKLVYKAKQTLKEWLGRNEPDLYDISSWSVFRK